MTYTHGHHESVLRSHKWRTVDNSAAYLAPRLTNGISVLDLGCGPGTITADIGRRVAPGRVLGFLSRSLTVILSAAANRDASARRSKPNTDPDEVQHRATVPFPRWRAAAIWRTMRRLALRNDAVECRAGGRRERLAGGA